MSNKYLKQLTYDEAKELVYQSNEIKSILNDDKWQQAKYNGTRLIKLCEDNKLMVDKAK